MSLELESQRGVEVENSTSEKSPMSIAEAAQLLGIDAYTASQNPSLLVEAFDALRSQDTSGSWAMPETSMLDEKGIPAQLDWLIADLRTQAGTSTDTEKSSLNFESLPQVVDIADQLESLGFASDPSNINSVLTALDQAEETFAKGDGQGGDPLAVISPFAREILENARNSK